MKTLCRKFTKIIHKIENGLIASWLLVPSSKKKSSWLTRTQIYIVMSTARGWKIKVTEWICFLCFAVRYISLWGAAAVGNSTMKIWILRCGLFLSTHMNAILHSPSSEHQIRSNLWKNGIQAIQQSFREMENQCQWTV